MKSTYYLNGEYIEASKALISVDDRGFQFSDGIYEVIWICDSNPIDIGDHFLRLKSSLKEISLNVKKVQAYHLLVAKINFRKSHNE